MKEKYYLFFVLNVGVAVLYYFFNQLPIPANYANIVSIGFNAVLGSLLALLFLNKHFIHQWKSFSLRWIVLGLSLTSFVAYMGNYFYTTNVAQPTINAFYYTLTNEILFLAMPLLVLGEEILSINLTIALQKVGINFWLSSIVVAVLFAAWHIKSFGFVPLQLLMIIFPIRLALNYTWRETYSLPVVWLVHYLFNIIAFKIFYS